MNRLLDAGLRLIYPLRAVCMGCGCMTGCREDWVCPDCRRQLSALWMGAAAPPQGFGGAAFAFHYAGPAASIAGRLKYGGIRRLADFMAADMVRACGFIEPTGADMVTFVPMHTKRQRRRGFNHAQLLARSCADRLGLPCVDAIARLRDTPQQARLDAGARRGNLAGAFGLKAPVDGRRVLLVDDICTTGATAAGCAAALRAGGAAAVYLLCWAQAGKRQRDGEGEV